MVKKEHGSENNPVYINSILQICYLRPNSKINYPPLLMTLPPALAHSPKLSMITDGLGMWVTRYSLYNVFVIFAIVGLCLLLIDRSDSY